MNGQFSLGDMHPVKYFFGISIGLGLLFAFISGGPDTEPTNPFWLVLVQWQLQTSLPMGLLILSQLLLAKMHRFNQFSIWKQVITSGVIGGTLFVPVALLIDVYLMGELSPMDIKVELMDEWLGVVPPVVITWVLINLPWLMGLQFQKIESFTQQNLVTNQASMPNQKKVVNDSEVLPLMNQLPENIRGELYLLSSELHYLKVVTNQGKVLILGSLKDAIQQLPEQQGMQVHRSHWVSFVAIKKYNKEGRQGKLLLINGEEIPVSRSFNELVKQKLVQQT
jgi:hypothetical protein